MPTLLARRSQQRAERLVQREYEELRGPTLGAVRGRLAAQGLRLDDADLDAAYNQAWHGLYEQLVQGEEIENHGGFLVVAAHRRAIDEVRRLHPERRADDVDPDERPHDLDLTQRLDDRRRLLGAMEGMRERLSERERQAAALCYLHGYSRPEAAAALGLAPKRMEKLMDGVSGKLGTLTSEIDDGDWCESRQSLMKAYAYGVLDPDGERYAIARAHLEECPACRKYVRSLRGMSAVVPPVWLPLAALGLLGLGGAGAASAAAVAHGGAAGAAGASGAAGGGGAAGGAGGGIGAAGWGAAVAASAAIAAGGIGAWAVTSGGEDPQPPTTSPVTQAAPPATTAAATPKPAKKPAAKKPAAKQAKAPPPAPAAQPVAQPAAQPATPAPEPEPQPAPEKPTVDAEPEFGFER